MSHTSNDSDAGKGEKDKLWWKIKWDRLTIQFQHITTLSSLICYWTTATTSNDVIIRLRRGFRFLFWPVVCLLMICSVMFVSIHQQREYPITNICIYTIFSPISEDKTSYNTSQKFCYNADYWWLMDIAKNERFLFFWKM